MNDKNTVFAFIKEMIVEMKDSNPADIKPEIAIEALGLDSLDFVEIQVGVKRKFGVALSPTIFERQINTLAQLCEYIESAETTLESAE